MNSFRRIPALAIALGILTLAGCGGDDPKPLSIVGKWEIQSAEQNIVVPGGISLVAYLVTLGLPQTDAEEFAAELQTGELIVSTGTMEFTSNGNYEVIEDNSDRSSGRWEITSDNKTLTIDKGTNGEVVGQVTTLTETDLVIDLDLTEIVGFPRNSITCIVVLTLKKV